MKTKETTAVVKIDSGLLDKVESFISKSENKFKYNNKKQFIDIAVNDFLERVARGEREK